MTNPIIDISSILIDGYRYQITPYGLRQINYTKIFYDSKYIEQGSRCTVAMCHLRHQFLLDIISKEYLSHCSVLELGPGNGCFFSYLKPMVRSMDGYDIVPSEFSTCATFPSFRHFNLLCAFDVIEHFDDIDDIWSIDFDFGFFSLPCPPRSGITSEWRHFKPNEHLWHIDRLQFFAWMNDNGYDVCRYGSPEDAIRIPWSSEQINIQSFIVKKR